MLQLSVFRKIITESLFKTQNAVFIGEQVKESIIHVEEIKEHHLSSLDKPRDDKR